MDVDGVISLWGFPAQDRPAGSWLLVDGVAHYLSARAGEHLLALASSFELRWCTGWEEKANEYLPHALGLPGPLPFVALERPPATPGDARHWKLDAIDADAGPARALAWLDDTFDDSCRTWAARRPGPTLLVPTHPAIGLTDAHVAELRAWAQPTR